MTRDKLVTAAMLHQMHPDIFEATPEVAFLAKCWKEQDDMQVRRNFWMDAYLDGMPVDWVFNNSYMSTFQTVCNVTVYVEGSYTEIDVEATTKRLAQVVKWARSRGYGVTKRYEDTDFNIDLEVPGTKSRMTFYTSRQAMCTRKFVGTEVIAAKPAEPEKVVDKYDWECERIAFLGIDTDE